MNIKKSWFYKLKDLKSSSVEIEDNIAATIFYEDNKNIDFFLWENAFVEIYVLSQREELDNDLFNINIYQNRSWSNLKFNCLALSKDNNKNNLRVFSEISSNNTKTNLKILSISWNNWFIDLDGIIKINPQVSKSKARLEEENLFLWTSWKVKWVPTLLVESDDVEASHACRIEKISDESLFYLRSRWIWKEDSINMLIKAKISDLFKCIIMLDKDFYDELLESITRKC